MKGDRIQIDASLSLCALRLLIKSTDLAINNWAGGSPAELKQIVELREELGVVLMTARIEHGLI